ncbi:heptaprenyl diphosphate synthase component II [Massilibacterium senegalense]|uniref:heptaprenyl diphosphate synthase component II n=1 Tax=Massilibacterium senegalense TaxID=1632858 RepID=UPI000784B644|nr:heptaprenyl diphosphate synthase component II [Massilibacterium senegalense]
MKLRDIYSNLSNDIQKVEKELEQSLQAKQPVLKQASLHLLKAGGKRIRPVFVLLAGKFGDYNIEEIKKVAVPLELIHMASLVHDDVIDDAEMRRGRKTIKAKWDNRIAMYTGDYILARALSVITDLQQEKGHQILSRAIREMTIGEIEQIRDQYNWDQHLYHYLKRIKRKTALLIAVSCHLGALSTNVKEKYAWALYRFGYNVGMSFQITDDILDFTGTEKQLGKPAGSDLLQGNLTLPALYAIQDPLVREKVDQITKESQLKEEAIEEILTLIRRSGGIEYADQCSKRYLKRAFDALEILPDIDAKQSLFEIAKYIGTRKY